MYRSLIVLQTEVIQRSHHASQTNSQRYQKNYQTTVNGRRCERNGRSFSEEQLADSRYQLPA